MQRLNPLQCSYVKSIQIDLDRRRNYVDYVMFRQEGPFQRLVNQRVVDTTFVEGWAHLRVGADGMMYVEAALGTARLLVFNAVVALNARRAVPVIA
jgi:hypothetical protein